MTSKRIAVGLLVAVAWVATSTDARAILIIPTNIGGGADAEVREEAGTTNRGANTELATRIKDDAPTVPGAVDSADRNSAMYLRFDITGLTLDNVPGAVLRLTYRNNNLTGGRIQDAVLGSTGLRYYGLDIDHPGNSWDELLITYNNAPGLLPDGNNGTKDYDTSPGNLILLGEQDFPPIGTQNHLPIGGPLDFNSAALEQLLKDAITAGKDSVTIVAGIKHDGTVGIANWINFNYLFNPKEQTTLTTDNYDPDSGGPMPPVGNLYGTDNSMGAFSPQLRLIPEPSSVLLLGLGAIAFLLMIRRRS